MQQMLLGNSEHENCGQLKIAALFWLKIDVSTFMSS